MGRLPYFERVQRRIYNNAVLHTLAITTIQMSQNFDVESLESGAK